MESKGPSATPARLYQDFEPSMEWVPEDDSDTLLVYLPGFAKEQLRVQLRARNLIISGERKLHQNTWSRFRVEFPVSANCDLNKISAKFEGNILFVRQPKLITPAPKPDHEEAKPVTTMPQKPAAEKPEEAKPATTPQKPVDHQSNAAAAEVKPAPTLEPKVEKKQVAKDEDVAKNKVEEKGEGKLASGSKTTAEGVRESGSTTKTSEWDDMKNKNGAYGEVDKTILDKYKRATGAFAMKLKTSCDVVNALVVLMVGLVIGFYVTDSIRSWGKA